MPRLITTADFDCVFMCIYGNKQEENFSFCGKGEKVCVNENAYGSCNVLLINQTREHRKFLCR